MAVANRESLKC